MFYKIYFLTFKTEDKRQILPVHFFILTKQNKTRMMSQELARASTKFPKARTISK